MNIIKTLKKFLVIKNSILLGRWSKLKTKKELDRRIYLANIDNCGTCKYEKYQ